MARVARLAVWLTLMLILLNVDLDCLGSPWCAPQEEWFHHAIQYSPEYAYARS